MRALVTGGAGFIGSSIARALLAEDVEVVVLDNLSTGQPQRIPEGAELIVGDLTRPDAVRGACKGVDVIFHQAAIRSVPKSVDNPLPVEETNIRGTLNLLEAATNASVERLVYASSSSVYGGGRSGEPQHESDPVDPRSPYAVSKLSAEQFCRVWTLLERIETVSLRYFNVYGPGQRPDSTYSAVFPGFIAALKRGEQPVIHSDGEQTRDFCYIDDVIAANFAAADAPSSATGRCYNIGADDPRSVNDVYRSVAAAMGTDIKPVYGPVRAGDVRSTWADISDAKEQLGWQPKARWDDAVKATVEWFESDGAMDPT
ncbi:MAG: NAD-dependent epimerase/dehydratase family protein [Acidimicrobiia bacterium]|nr:NAD-dependent epimerase/dehydratase family protein [Acidimicrobiia bacterium]